MCGIYGYIGSRNITDELLRGLSKLDYRGYDSAGIAISDTLTVEKTKGRIDDLREHTTTRDGTAGIAHTRWATHGAVTDDNAHPHVAGDIAVVHNGIIENHEELKEELQHRTFTSETDTEVIAHLLDEAEGDLARAMRTVLPRLEGSFAIAAIMKGGDEIVAARRKSPLCIGRSDDASYISSDEGSFAEHADRVAHLPEDTVIRIDKNGAQPAETVEYESLDTDTHAITKDGHETYMHKEIHEQPGMVHDNQDREINVDLEQYDRVYLTACGTSLYACKTAKYILDRRVQVHHAAEFRYHNTATSDDLVIAVSQSGETADTLGAVRASNENGADTLGIVNEERTAIARETDRYIGVKAGKEVGVASTKAFTAQLLTFHQIQGTEGLERLPHKLRTVLSNEEAIKQVATQYADTDSMLFLGRGLNHPAAEEGALKLKEISYIHAEGYPAAELKHGPIALVDENTPSVFVANGPLYDKTYGNMEEVKARNGDVIAVATDDIDVADHVLPVPESRSSRTPFLNVAALQLFAYHVARRKENDVDKPRNLAKCVTVE